MSIAFLFAGQGTQHPGMGADLYERYGVFRQVFDQAQLDFDLKALCFEGLGETLSQTRYTQPCMVAFAAGMTAVLKEHGVVPDMAAGLSLGEYSALHAAGVFDAQTAIELVAFRGRAMEEAVQNRPCGMSAILMLDRQSLQRCCDAAKHDGVVEIANYNCPGQLVIGGDQKAVDTASRLALEAGAKRAIALNVSGPFHTSLMKPAGDRLRQRFETVAFGPMSCPVYFNCLGAPMGPGDTIAALLERQVQSSVYLEDTIRAMIAAGADTFVEIGPGKALSGFVKKLSKEVRLFAAETAQDVENLAASLKGA